MRVTFSSAAAVGVREFACSSCGHRATARVVGVGEGSATILNLEPDEVSAARAQKDAERDVERTFSVAACPKCGRRDPAAVRRWWWRRIGLIGAIVALIALAGWAPLLFGMNMRPSDKIIAGWAMTGIAVFIGAIAFLIEGLMKWRRVSRGVFWL